MPVPDQMPPDPMSQLAEGAAQTHELFTSYVQAGFDRGEALQIVIAILMAHIQRQPPAA